MQVPEKIPAVSWVLCTHVANEQLRLALNSCLDQTFTDFELLVVANGESAEKIAEQVKQWVGTDARLRVLSTEVRHLPFSLSLGLHHARAEFVARMDSDDLSKPERLQRQVKFMHSHPDVAVLGSCYELIDSSGHVLRQVRLPLDDTHIRRAMHWSNPICHPTVMFRKNVVLTAGGYVGGLQAEDYDLWTRLATSKNVKFANLNEICLSYRAIGAGPARGARAAYASVAAAQVRAFLMGEGIGWLFGAMATTFKLILRTCRFPFSEKK
jgi:glycosyltransferase involved in cell wall biosynthesis